MKNKIRLAETEKYREIVDPWLCLNIYKVCNNKQFEGCYASEFINFMNLAKYVRQLKVRNKQKLKVSYMADVVKNNLPYPDDNFWHEMFLDQCDIKPDYLSRHSGDFYGETSTQDNQDYIAAIQEAVNNWRNRNN